MGTTVMSLRVSGFLVISLVSTGVVLFFLDVLSATKADSTSKLSSRVSSNSTSRSNSSNSSDDEFTSAHKPLHARKNSSFFGHGASRNRMHHSSRKPHVTFDLGIEIVNDDDPPFDYWPIVPREHYDNLIRSFEAWSSESSWCQTQQGFYDSNTPAGLLFVKVPKAASSTLSGLVLRIAHRHGSGNRSCITRQSHVETRPYPRRDRSKSFMLGNVRDIASREVSHVYFRFLFNNQFQKAENNKLLDLLQSGPHLEWWGRERNDLGFQLGYMATQSVGADITSSSLEQPAASIVMNLSSVQHRVEQVMQAYDFITVTERMDESLVVLQLLLDLDPHDLLYVSSKVAGSYVPRRRKCVLIERPHLSPAITSYLSSEQWYSKNYGDYLLYKTVNASLDATIERLGRDRFEAALDTYRTLLHKAQEQCSDAAVFPCSTNGTLQAGLSRANCYIRDWGCGYTCLDQFG